MPDSTWLEKPNMLNGNKLSGMLMKKLNEKALPLNNQSLNQLQLLNQENTDMQPIKEYEVHGSQIPQDDQKSLDEIFREAARDGSLYE